MNEQNEDIRKLKTELWDLRFDILKVKISVPWTLEDLQKATKR